LQRSNGWMMEELVKELRRLVPFKNSTVEGDVVMIAIENPKSALYAIVTKIERDESKKSEWWHVTMQILSVPPQKVTWTLREAQFTGAEIFTMGDDGRFIQAVDLADDAVRPPHPPSPKGPKKLAAAPRTSRKVSPLRRVK